MTFEKTRDLTQETNPGEELLIAALKSAVPILSYAYVFDWIPEQGLTIYSIVVPDRKIAIVEFAESGEAEISLHSLRDYKLQHPKLSAEKRR